MDKKEEQAACNGDQQDVDLVENMDEELAAKEKLTAGETIKFTSVKMDSFDGKNGEAKVDIQVPQTTVGMGKEELMKYANDPFWIRLRMFLFVFFWVAWVAMLVGAVVIIILAPRCPPAPKIEWFQKSAFYQVDVQAFKDSDGDGVGDLKGLTSKLDYFKELNVGTIMLSNFFKSSDSDGIIQHKEINDKVGTLNDFDQLVNHLKEKDIRLVIDFNPNHSSDKHPWFEASVEGQEPYKDFYVWVKPSSEGQDYPPNNWLNLNGESAWTYNDERQLYYLHTFGKDKPDLNLRNELVKLELREIIDFWLKKGVDGFNVLAASHLVENYNLPDEPIGTATRPAGVKRRYEDMNHLFTVDQPENAELIAEWHEILNNHSSTGNQKILMPELIEFTNSSRLYYGNDTYQLAELPYSTFFTKINGESTGIELKHHIQMINEFIPPHGWPTILLGKKGIPRQASRVGNDLVDAMHMISVVAKGTPIMYYADELGTTDFISQQTKLVTSNTVMLWSNDTLGGFSNGSRTVFEVHPERATFNVDVEQKDKQSHLNVYSSLLSLRGQPALSFGIQEYPIVTNETFSLLRVRKGSPGYLVVVNLGGEPLSLDFSEKSNYLPENARVEIRSSNIIDGSLAEGDHPKISLNHVPLKAKQSVIFSFVPIFKE